MQFVSGLDGRRFRKPGIVDIICRTPRIVDPVRRNLEDVVCVVQIVIEDDPLLRPQLGKFTCSIEVPRIVLSQVEPAESVPSEIGPAASPWHLIERSPYVTVRSF